jgi:CHASE2 domain-containing sensor protein
MWALLSRPAGGSLRVTWVTPATLLLVVVAGLGTAALAVLCLVTLFRGGGWPLAVGAAVCAALAAGCAAVGLVGAAQRRRG